MLVKNGEMLLTMSDEICLKRNSAYAHINFACLYVPNALSWLF